MHVIEVRDSTGETKKAHVKTEEQIMQEWTKSVVIVTHSSSSLRLAAVILDAKNNQRVIVEIPIDQNNSRRVKDFCVEIYGVNSHGKIVTCSSVSLDPNEQNKTVDPAEGMNHLELSRKHISNAKYEVRFDSSDETKFIFLKEVETNENHFFLCASGTAKYAIPFSLRPTKVYEINAFRGSCDGSGRFTLSEHGFLKFQAAMNKGLLSLLHQRAIEFCKDRTLHRRISFLYRNKPHEYFDKIYKKDKQRGMMTKYMKNDGGDQASPLNRAIQGLFFSAYYMETPDGRIIPPLESPFGDIRFHVAVPFFLNSCNNLYFADFFCHYTNHHVTLVVTEANSYSDRFCKENLIFLESFNNPFLYYNRVNNCFVINTSVNVEVFYTENINVAELILQCPHSAFFTSCISVGDSRKKSFIGQSKNVNCDICNLNTI